MMRIILVAVAGAGLVAWSPPDDVAWSPPDGDAEVKCTPRTDADGLPDVVTIVDGEVVDSATFGIRVHGLAEDGDTGLVELVCWRDVERMFGVRVRHGAWVLFTRSGQAEKTRASLRRLIAAQAAHRDAHGAYAKAPSRLPEDDPPPAVIVHFTTAADGWSARTEHRFLAQRCYAYAGPPPAGWEEVLDSATPALPEREAACFSRDSSAGRWERITPPAAPRAPFRSGTGPR